METLKMPVKIGDVLDVDFNETCSAPCNKCGQETLNYVFAQRKYGDCTCKKCMHAYFCFLLLHEARKAEHQKKDNLQQKAEFSLQSCAANFKSKYGADWRDHLFKVWPAFDRLLNSGITSQIEVENLIVEAQQNGYILRAW